MERNLTHKTAQEAHRQKKNLFVILSLCLFLIIPMVSALDFDNSQNIKDTIGKAGYNDIEINNAFGLGAKLWSGTLETNNEILKENKI